MFSRRNQVTMRVAPFVALIGILVGVVAADARERIRIPVGRGEVITSTEDVVTVAVAEPKIADAAVGSQKTVVVNAKSAGITTLVVYNQVARFTVYDVEVYHPGDDHLIALHCNVSELTDKATHDLGFDYAGQVTSTVPWLDGTLSGGLFVQQTGQGDRTGLLDYVRTPGDLLLSTQWKALEQTGDIRSLANPTLVARSGYKATFLSGGEFPVPVANNGVATTTAGAAVINSVGSVTIEWKEFGVKLEFTPTMMEDGTLQLEVNPEVSELDFTTPLKINGFNIPVINTNKAGTTVFLKPGEHLMLGGLHYKKTFKSIRKVPLLGHLPLFGFFFTSTSSDVQERDLLITVAPEIMASSANRIPPLTEGTVPGTFENRK